MNGKRAAPKYRAVCIACHDWLVRDQLARFIEPFFVVDNLSF